MRLYFSIFSVSVFLEKGSNIFTEKFFESSFFHALPGCYIYTLRGGKQFGKLEKNGLLLRGKGGFIHQILNPRGSLLKIFCQ